MSKMQDPIFLKLASGAVSSDTKIPAECVYLRGLKVLSDELAGLWTKESTLNKREQTSIRALIAYIEYTRGIHEAVICALVENQFGFGDIRKMYRADYDKIVTYLVDLDPRMIVN